MSKLIDVLLQRDDSSVPWGFSIHGGFDRDVAPFISSVAFGTLASQHLNAGDRILQIQRQPAGGLLQSELDEILRQDGRDLRLMVEKTHCLKRTASSPSARLSSRFHSPGLREARREIRSMQKRFYRLSESLIEDHFRRVKNMLDVGFELGNVPRSGKVLNSFGGWDKDRSPENLEMASTEVNNADPRAPNVRHLVYSMYRKMLDEYNDQANEIVDALPRDIVQEDADIYRHLQEILKQQHQIDSSPGSEGPQDQQQQAPPPPPPPPPPTLSGTIPGRRIKSEIPERGLEPPPAIQNAMLTKDKKPFTYTPGGIDLSEIRSPKMQRRITRNACAEEMTGRPAPTTNHPVPTGPPPPTPYSAMQMQMPTSVLPARGMVPPPPPMPSTDGVPPPPPPPPPPTAATPTSPQAKPPAFHRPPTMSFDPNEILARANRNQNQEAQKKAPEEEPQKVIVQNAAKPQNEPGQIYVPPVAPKSPVEATPTVPSPAQAHSPRGQVGSIYVPPVTAFQEQSTPQPTFAHKMQSPSPVQSPMSTPASAEVKTQAPWVTVFRTPQATPPSWMSSHQPESPKPQENTRIIPIQIEGREPPKPQSPMQTPQFNAQQQQQQFTVQQQPQQQFNVQQQQQQKFNIQQQQQQYQVQQQEQRQQVRGHTRVIPIQIEGASQPSSPQTYQNKFNPMTPTSPVPYSPPSADKEQKPQWAPVQPRPTGDGAFGQQRVQPEYGTYNTAGVPVSQLRKMQLSDDDRALMDKFKSQIEKHGNDAITDENANPRYRGGHIPSRVFKMLDESVDDERYLHRESDPRYRGPAIPSRAFRLLQNMTDTAGDVPQQVPKSPMRAPVSRPLPGSPERPPGPYVPASEQQVQEPRKYTGGSIPSRSFRMLQQMTGQEVTAQNHPKANSSSGRSTPVPGMARWCSSPLPVPFAPPVDPYWYWLDPYFMYNYVPDVNGAYGYFPPSPYPPGCYTPANFQAYPNCLSDSDEQGYSSTDELGQYYANYRSRMAYSPSVWNQDPQGAPPMKFQRSGTPSITVTPVARSKKCYPPLQRQGGASEGFAEEEDLGNSKILEEEQSESSSEEETETDSEGGEEEHASKELGESREIVCKSNTLQTLKSVSNVGIYASESTATITNEGNWEEDNREEGEEEEAEEEEEEVEEEGEEESSFESSQEVSQDNLHHQLSVIFEESEHSDAESIRQRDKGTVKNMASDSEVSNMENGEEESDDDDLDTESSVTVRLPLRLKFSRGENDEDVTTVIVGDSEIKKSDSDSEEYHMADEEEEEEEEKADVSVTFSLPSRSNSVITIERRATEDEPKVTENEKTEDKGEAEDEVCVCFSLKNAKPFEEEKVEERRTDRFSCDSKTEESDSTHCEDDSSSTSADTVVKHKEDTDEEETEKQEEKKVEDFKTWLNTENEKDWKGNEGEGENSVDDISYEAGVSKLEQMISSMLDTTRASFENGAEKKVRKDNSQEESEDDSGVTSDISLKHLASETDVDTESEHSEFWKMSKCQRASTHSRLFKLLQEECGECGNEESTEEEKSTKEPKLSPSSESLTSRKEKLSLPLRTPSEAESLSGSSGFASPSSPIVSERLVKELVQSLLQKKKGKKFRKLPLAKLHAAALRILQEDMDACDTSSNSASGDDGFLLSPLQKTKHSPKTAYAKESESEPAPDAIYGANYHDYLDYYDTWGNACYPSPEHEIVPSKAFRMLSHQPNGGDGPRAKCPRVPNGGTEGEALEKGSGRRTPFAGACPEADDFYELSFEEKREKVGKVLESGGK